jgi:5'-3' exoribonuclease 2
MTWVHLYGKDCPFRFFVCSSFAYIIEPNLVLLRERVVFSMVKRRLMEAAAVLAASQQAAAVKRNQDVKDFDESNGDNINTSLSTGRMDAYIHNVHFEFLHMGVLRDYLAFEFETSNVMADSPWDLERAIDDFVFLTFFVGNDFLPHMPALDIADHAFDLLFVTYKNCRRRWLDEAKEQGRYTPGQAHDCYLTHAGTIVSGRRLEDFLSEVGAHEVPYYDKKKRTASKDNEQLRKTNKRFGWGDSSSVPTDNDVQSKEESDRSAYRQMLLEQEQRKQQEQNPLSTGKVDSSTTPVLSGQVEFQPGHDEFDEGMLARMSNLLRTSIGFLGSSASSADTTMSGTMLQIDDQDLKGRYYFDKFEFSPYDSEKHRALRKAYVEGLVWNLKYYYQGCVSWEWFYPYHYGTLSACRYHIIF